EVFRGTGLKFSSFRVKKKVTRSFQIIKIGLDRDRDELYQRIDFRMDQMIASGLFDEADALFGKRHLNALQTVGYSEIFGFLEGKYDREEAIRLLKRNSRRYAKRQLTWFRRDGEIRWFYPDQLKEISAWITAQMD
ncbi:tRNA (adenosine(37)-N6)-dimethylallyltransferase MiaA, partial [Algoriphagus sp.]